MRKTGKDCLRIAQMVPNTTVEGPGHRFALWLQGCPIRCPGCCNPKMLPFDGGTTYPVTELAAQIVNTKDIEGVTLLGGEPFAQAEPAARLCYPVRRAGLSIVIFTGYELSELYQLGCSNPFILSLLGYCDLLIDGPYRKDLPEQTRPWIGSNNQKFHLLSSRYCMEDILRLCFQYNRAFEIRLENGAISINGWPSLELQGGQNEKKNR